MATDISKYLKPYKPESSIFKWSVILILGLVGLFRGCTIHVPDLDKLKSVIEVTTGEGSKFGIGVNSHEPVIESDLK